MQERRGQQLDRRTRFAGEVHVGQAADKADGGLSGGELIEGGADDQIRPTSELLPDMICHEPVDIEHVRGEKGGEA